MLTAHHSSGRLNGLNRPYSIGWMASFKAIRIFSVIFAIIIIASFIISKAFFLTKNKNNVQTDEDMKALIKAYIEHDDRTGLVQAESEEEEFFEVPGKVYKDWTNYTYRQIELRRTGPGEGGMAVKLNDPAERLAARKTIAKYSHNGVVSDKISLDRLLPDLRIMNCHRLRYSVDLPAVSVIIVFHNEYLSSLLRTVHSLVNRTPPELLREVILVDDKSDDEALGWPLEMHFRDYHPELVRIIRLREHSGLMKARMVGIKASKSDIVVVMDGHMEVFTNWLPPLIQPIVDDWRVMTEPLLPPIDWNDYHVPDWVVRGWMQHFDRDLMAQWHDRNARRYQWKPYENPVIVGAIMAINKTLFWHLGGYDDQFEIWGGEQFEISFKVWMCIEGGRVLTVPCSIVGHNYKEGGFHPYFQKKPYLMRNLNRVVEIFFDEQYKSEYYDWTSYEQRYNHIPTNLTKALALKKRLNCTTFQWYLDHVFPEFVQWYPMKRPNYIFQIFLLLVSIVFVILIYYNCSLPCILHILDEIVIFISTVYKIFKEHRNDLPKKWKSKKHFYVY